VSVGRSESDAVTVADQLKVAVNVSVRELELLTVAVALVEVLREGVVVADLVAD
jgi:hypothetical protein